MNFVKSSLRYPQVTLAVLLMAFLAGVYSLLTMPRREDPKITIRVGLVVAYFPGATAEQVEAQVTQKLEEYLFRFSEVRKEKTCSTTRDGQVIINVELNENVARPDEFWSKLRHELNVAKAVDLPPGVRGPVVSTDFGDTVAMLVAVESDRLSYGDLRAALRKMEDQLRTVKGVSKIKRYGEQPEQIYLTANSERLAQYGLKLPQVVQVLQSQNSIGPTGNVKVGTADVPLHTSGFFSSEQQISSQIIGSAPTGQVIRVGDVATVTRRYAEPTALIRVDGQRALLLSVEMLEGNNIVDFGHAVQAKLEESKQLLPADLQVRTIVDQPELVDHSISHFIREFFLAIISVVVVCMLLLPFSIASVAAMAIPVTVAVTFAVMNMMGIELHQVSLAALIVVLGMVVDDAIVIADNYVELLDEGLDRWEAAWRSASNLVIPVLTATLTIIASFLPMVLLTGSVGEFIRALPITLPWPWPARSWWPCCSRPSCATPSSRRACTPWCRGRRRGPTQRNRPQKRRSFRCWIRCRPVTTGCSPFAWAGPGSPSGWACCPSGPGCCCTAACSSGFSRPPSATSSRWKSGCPWAPASKPPTRPCAPWSGSCAAISA